MALPLRILELVVSTDLGGGPSQVNELVTRLPREEFAVTVAGPPGGVYVVQRDAAGLNVGADAELVGGTEQYRDLAGPAVGEQRGLLQVGRGVVNEPDPRGRDVGGDQAAANLAVHLAAGCRVRGTEVAEDDLEPAARGAKLVAGQGQVAGGVVDAGDVGDDRVGLAKGGRGDADEFQVERGLAAVAADLEHVVVVRVGVPEVVGPLGEVRDIGAQLR